MPGLIELPALIISSLATTAFAANALYLGTYALAYAGLAFGAQALSNLLVKKPDVPKGEDGKYNLKQSVPSLSFVLGRVKKAGDYVFLEESDGIAFHVIVEAGHRIQGFVKHYLHDEEVALVGGGVVSPPHFFLDGETYVVIDTRVGLPGETAYGTLVSRFPTIWSSNHRGDGLASIMMYCVTADSKDFLKIYPNQMPQHSAVIDGALLFDPRNPEHDVDDPGSWEFSRNLALMRLWHLCHPVGGKLSYADMYLPDWINAADVCDQTVTNRAGSSEPRYHGGLWFRADNNPVDVGRIIDQAAELVVFERPDGLIGVHAGEYVEPDIRLTANDIIHVSHDTNQRRGSTVLAVRGRWTDPAARFNTVDAAIYGDPYIGDDSERTRTIENQAVQYHNHIARLEKLTYTRANAPRVTVTTHYSGERKKIPYRRFVRAHYPPRLSEVIIEITTTPKISLRNMTIEFSGIVMPADLYAFDAATEEGAPGSNVIPLPPAGVPLPLDFNVTILNEVVSGGSTAAYALASWTHVSNALIYEFEWEKTVGGEPAQSTNSTAGQDQVRSNYLSDGAQYRFRLRTWSNGVSSEWTNYEIRTATADPTPPGVVTGAGVTGGAGQGGYNWTAPNSANYAGVRLYINTVNTFSGSTLVGTEYGPPNFADGKIVTGLTAGIKYGFVVSINASGVPAAAVATSAFTVT
ncbi:hypothetical protein [Rhizobium laguerreae]|uniref:Fibronectin type-III domain-containing protein n=1 Tax=Rhizobium laguerreae TaxID=1076926 RepID=A0AAX2QMI0_9HYPH|nr:hypothetical protein [Rhizobium laguerreae]TCU25279.1 hypothetical protein EV131_105393 [Rhizobium laguerreae]